MLTFEGESFSHYRDHLLNLEVDTYMANYVPKNSIEKYKDMYISLNNYEDSNTYESLNEVYDCIFSPIMDEFDLATCDWYEALYFLNFIGEIKNVIGKPDCRIHPSWKKY